MNLDYVVIGKRIRELRKEKGWTQERLAERAGIEPSNLSHIERAATKLSLPTLVGIANALEVSLDEIVYSNLVKSAHISAGRINELLEDCSPEELLGLAEILKSAKAVLRAKQ
ncbi:MAG: helix-turn-helix transcriptional regulator [Clostridia bacterium]|nr:helix-turn-helix transcriptional regulator [Clostridia bacterium]